MPPNTSSPETSAQKYWAFISYRHADNLAQDRDWATWLHQEIERYEVPAELIDTKNERDDLIPERIYPIFRDEESLPADANLANSISNALDRSLFLVALCSPRAVESTYVAQEIDHFKDTGRGDRIIAGIIAGEPGHPLDECFPEPLREIASPDGKLSEPIAADFRLPDGREGYTSAEAYKRELLKTFPKKEANKKAEKYDERLQLMKLKIIAGILGLPLETIRDRDKAYRLQLAQNRSKKLRSWLAVTIILAVAAAVSAEVARKQTLSSKKSATAARESLEKNMLLVTTARAVSNLDTVPLEARREIVDLYKKQKSTSQVVPPSLKGAVRAAWIKSRELSQRNIGDFEAFAETGRGEPGDFSCRMILNEERESVIIKFETVKFKNTSYFEWFPRKNRILHLGAEAGKIEFKNPNDFSIATNLADENRDVSFSREWSFLLEESASMLVTRSPEGGVSSFVTRLQHSDGINSFLAVGFGSPIFGLDDSRLLFTGGGRLFDIDGRAAHDTSIRAWRLRDNGSHYHVDEAQGAIIGHEKGILTIAVSDLSERLGSLDDSGNLIYWDLAEIDYPKQVGSPSTDGVGGAMYRVELHPERDLVAASGYAGLADIISLNENSKLRILLNPSGGYLEMSPDGKFLAVNLDEKVGLMNWNRELVEVSPKIDADCSKISLFAFASPSLIYFSDQRGLFLWDVKSASISLVYNHGDDVSSSGKNSIIGVNRTMAGNIVIVEKMGKLTVIDSASNTIMSSTELDVLHDVDLCAVGAGNRFAFSTGADIFFGQIVEADMLVSGKVTLNRNVSALKFTPSGEFLFVGLEDGSIDSFDVDHRDRWTSFVKIHDGYIADIAFSQEGNEMVVCSGDGTISHYKSLNPERIVIRLDERDQF